MNIELDILKEIINGNIRGEENIISELERRKNVIIRDIMTKAQEFISDENYEEAIKCYMQALAIEPKCESRLKAIFNLPNKYQRWSYIGDHIHFFDENNKIMRYDIPDESSVHVWG